jgi:hypothetical protein
MARTISGSYSVGITLTNPSDNPVTVTGTISLGAFGVDLQAASAWSIFNSGSILGLVTGAPGNSYGVELTAGGYVRNSASGLIRAGVDIDISGAAGSVHNKGSIVGQAALYSPDWGIGLHNGGYVYNGSSGRIKHAGDGIFITGGAGTVINEGSIGSANRPPTALRPLPTFILGPAVPLATPPQAGSLERWSVWTSRAVREA